ncbi:hypothetical protein HU200_066092 [Digitaria exilis]|uniref:DUF1618 domain-containing protein n=1 Tax=Digitaria exilis TaxID=1010633 RepID=A0A834ZYV2_9POAL|nr:hypothetical protein HU200_066092 [Digitaria exilis]
MSAGAGAGAFPSWVLLEPFILRRDRASTFPDETMAPISFSGTTSCGDNFFLAFHLVDPPGISSLYAHLPAFGKNEVPVAFLSTHRHLALLRVATLDYHDHLTQDLFVFDASASDVSRCLLHLPVCMEPPFDYNRLDGSLRRRRRHPRIAQPRLMAVKSMGILSRQDGEFAVAEMNFYMPMDTLFADICLFRSSANKWTYMRVPVLHSGDHALDTQQLCFWVTSSVVPVGRWLCWIDYYRGILFCDLFAKPNPTVSYLRLPVDEFPKTNNRSRTCRWMYRCVSAVDDGNVVKFVDVARSDDIGYGALRPGAGFTITCHTLMLDGVDKWDKETMGSVVWHKDWTVTSDELWSANPPELLPREAPTFPQVNIDRPHVVHFLLTEFGYVMKKMWVVAIDMSTGKVESCSQYLNGRDDIGTDREKLTDWRSICPMPFLPCEFTKYLHFPM